jgi:membrane fusion protein (multidrug efflux system)
MSDLGRAVYLVNEKNEDVIQPVVTGKWVGKNWVVTEGLKAGDKVIIDNLIKLRPGIPVSPHPADLSHKPSLKQTDSIGKK